eukprot:5427317-Amphidinium_carterae.1
MLLHHAPLGSKAGLRQTGPQSPFNGLLRLQSAQQAPSKAWFEKKCKGLALVISDIYQAPSHDKSIHPCNLREEDTT